MIRNAPGKRGQGGDRGYSGRVIRRLNEKSVREGGDYVLYWMQEAQRVEHNHALEYAVQKANERGQRLLVAFGLTDVCRRAYKRAVLPRHALPLRSRSCSESEGCDTVVP